MREIKFRAWDKVNRKWADHNQLLNEIKVNTSVLFPSILTIYDERFDICLDTGLKDKNGVEIYEGDILKNIEDKWIDYIVFQGAAFEFSDGSSYWDKINNVIGLNEFEIIGNIYENPDLIK